MCLYNFVIQILIILLTVLRPCSLQALNTNNYEANSGNIINGYLNSGGKQQKDSNINDHEIKGNIIDNANQASLGLRKNIENNYVETNNVINKNSDNFKQFQIQRKQLINLSKIGQSDDKKQKLNHKTEIINKNLKQKDLNQQISQLQNVAQKNKLLRFGYKPPKQQNIVKGIINNQISRQIQQNINTANVLQALANNLLSRQNNTVPPPPPLPPVIPTPPVVNVSQSNSTIRRVDFNITDPPYITATGINGSQVLSKPYVLPYVAPIVLRYDDYLQQYKPQYRRRTYQEQLAFRQSVYTGNVQLMNYHNQKTLRNFNMGLNIFADVNNSQFQQQFYKLVIPDKIFKQTLIQQAILKNSSGVAVYTVPPQITIDWSCLASQVISQGACGASYVIAPLQATAITLKIYNQSAYFLSIQEIISCGSNGQDLVGCQGGYFNAVFDYVRVHGVGQSALYYYDQIAKFQGGTSQCNKTVISSKNYIKNKIYIQDSKRIKYGDCQQLVKQLRFRAITVAVAADGLQFYTQGTFNATSQKINHGVTLVGYNPEKKYLIKNSWGRTWGMVGYGFVSQSSGVCNYAMYPMLAKQIGAPQLCSSQV